MKKKKEGKGTRLCTGTAHPYNALQILDFTVNDFQPTSM